MESWRQVWRDGVVPLLSTAGLLALREALASDDRRLAQGRTTSPPPMQCTAEWPVEAACPLAYACAAGLGGFAYEVAPDGTMVLPWRPGAATVAQVEEAFAWVCSACDQALNEPAGCRWFLNAVDEWPRPEMIRNLLPEVELALSQRGPSDDAQ